VVERISRSRSPTFVLQPATTHRFSDSLATEASLLACSARAFELPSALLENECANCSSFLCACIRVRPPTVPVCTRLTSFGNESTWLGPLGKGGSPSKSQDDVHLGRFRSLPRPTQKDSAPAWQEHLYNALKTLLRWQQSRPRPPAVGPARRLQPFLALLVALESAPSRQTGDHGQRGRGLTNTAPFAECGMMSSGELRFT